MFKYLPLFALAAVPFLFFGVVRAKTDFNIGEVCDLRENIGPSGRAAVSHHCKCLGLRYAERPGTERPPGAEATRCLGKVQRTWTDTDDSVLKEIAERDRRAASQRMFDKLPPATQEKIQLTYRQLREAAFRRDYKRVHELAGQILSEVDDYGDTRAIEAALPHAAP